jgi:hypothetical protein
MLVYFFVEEIDVEIGDMHSLICSSASWFRDSGIRLISEDLIDVFLQSFAFPVFLANQQVCAGSLRCEGLDGNSLHDNGTEDSDSLLTKEGFNSNHIGANVLGDGDHDLEGD